MRGNKISGLFIPDGQDAPHTIAQWVAGMDSNEQAHFFNSLASAVKEYPKPACFQWAYMAEKLTDDGRQLLEELAECSIDARPVSEVDEGAAA